MAFDPNRKHGREAFDRDTFSSASEPSRPAQGAGPSPGSGFAPPETWRAQYMRPERPKQHKRLTMVAGAILLITFIAGVALMWSHPGALGVTLAWVALFGMPVWVASWVMGADHLPEWYQPEHRVLLTDVDDLLGRDEDGKESVDRLERGSLISIGQRRTGETCLYGKGREHPVTPLLITQIRAASRPAEPAEIEEHDRAVGEASFSRIVRDVRRNEPAARDS